MYQMHFISKMGKSITEVKVEGHSRVVDDPWMVDL